jgi:hypothetical protein
VKVIVTLRLPAASEPPYAIDEIAPFQIEIEPDAWEDAGFANESASPGIAAPAPGMQGDTPEQGAALVSVRL